MSEKIIWWKTVRSIQFSSFCYHYLYYTKLSHFFSEQDLALNSRKFIPYVLLGISYRKLQSSLVLENSDPSEFWQMDSLIIL